MANAASDTKSYYMNSAMTSVVSVGMLRWSWCAYLSMEEPSTENDDIPDVDKPETLDDLLKKGSTRESWGKCKWKETVQGTRRLVEPGSDVPDALGEEKAPKFVVCLNKADPLHNEGFELAETIKSHGGNLTCIQATGFHCFGQLFDQKKMKEVIDAWSSAIWE